MHDAVSLVLQAEHLTPKSEVYWASDSTTYAVRRQESFASSRVLWARSDQASRKFAMAQHRPRAVKIEGGA